MAIWEIADVCNVNEQLPTAESGDGKVTAKVTPPETFDIIESKTIRGLAV